MSADAAPSPEGVRQLWLETRVSRALGYGVYVFRYGPWLIDCGFIHARQELLAWPGLRGAELCLLTHHHEDHSGNALPLARDSLPVAAPEPVVRTLEAGYRLGAYQRLVWGAPEPDPPVVRVAGAVEGHGQVLVPIHTPGHSADHFVYHEPERGIVFSGDLYISGRLLLLRADEDLFALIDSLKEIRALEPRVLYCAHRGRLDGPVDALTRKIDWLEEVVERARELADRGLGVRAITRRVLGRESLVYWVTRGDMSKRNLIEAALAPR